MVQALRFPRLSVRNNERPFEASNTYYSPVSSEITHWERRTNPATQSLGTRHCVFSARRADFFPLFTEGIYGRANRLSLPLPGNILVHTDTSLEFDNIDRLENTLSVGGTSHRINGIALAACSLWATPRADCCTQGEEV